jgi:hypothetical protein
MIFIDILDGQSFQTQDFDLNLKQHYTPEYIHEEEVNVPPRMNIKCERWVLVNDFSCWMGDEAFFIKIKAFHETLSESYLNLTIKIGQKEGAELVSRFALMNPWSGDRA